jgi:hypothetical protein
MSSEKEEKKQPKANNRKGVMELKREGRGFSFSEPRKRLRKK